MIQLLIGLGILSVLTAGMTVLISNSYKSVSAISQSLDKESLILDLRMATSASEVCNSLSFINQNFDAEELHLEQISQGSIPLVRRSTGGAGLSVGEIYLKKRGGFLLEKTDSTGKKLRLQPVSLVLNISKSEGVAGPRQTKDKQINFFIYLDESSKIQSCYSGSASGESQHICEVLLGGTYSAAPALNKPACILKPATKDFIKTGVRTTTAFSSSLNFVGGSGKKSLVVGIPEYEMTAPDCPAESIPTDCSVYMKTDAGQDQILTTMSFDVDGGDPVLPSSSVPINWYFAYFDKQNLDSLGRPRCTLRIANPTSNGAWAEWYPRVTCMAQSEVIFK